MEVPLSTQGPGLIESALLTVTQQKFAALSIAGGGKTPSNQLKAYLISSNSFYNIFCNILASKPTLQYLRQDNYIEDLLNNKKEDKGKNDSVPHTPNIDYAYYSKNISKQELKAVSSLFPKFKKLNKRLNVILNSFLSYEKICG